MTWPSLPQTEIRTSFRAELTLTPNQSAICVEIDLAGPLRRPYETLHSIDVCHDAVQPVWQGIFRDAVHLENEKGRHFLDGHRHPWLHRKGNDKSESSPDEVESRMGGRVPLDWAWTQMNLGIALSTLGQRESGTARLEQAVAEWDACLTVTASVWPSEWVDAIRSRRDEA